jgi:adrenodoxin-NADP+ reductase
MFLQNVINSFTTTALNNRTTFMGNVSIGSDITLLEIREEYNAVVLCYGAAQDRLLNIEGEDLANVISARRFVGWYNGVPHDKDLPISLDCETAVIIGHGNVAIDCARILLTAPQQILKVNHFQNLSLNTIVRL